MTMETSIPSNTSGILTTKITPRARFQTIAVVICLVGIALLFGQILHATGGHLNYTLDDPYIHLALAENLAQGHYGVNHDEYASPSSSILYPFLLAAVLAFGIGQFAPLVLNVVGAAGTAWILSGLFWDALHKSDSGAVSWLGFLALPFLVLAINGYGLGFTGMEHTLHVWASLAIIRGLIVMGRDQIVPLFLIIACIATPLLRFEGAALSGAALLAICFSGHWRAGIATGATLAVSFLLYVSAMSALGLPPMPSSVMVKSTATEAFVATRFDAIANELLQGFLISFTHRQGILLAILTVLVLLRAIWGDKATRTIAFVAAAAAIAHLLVGRWGWFYRYEVYIIATLIATVLHVWAPVLQTQVRRITTPALMIFALAVMGYIYLFGTFLTPAAARNIYEQQFQMHRFSTEFFPHPVAVTDLGWVTYDNDQYVLDLWGLGNENARTTFNAEGRTPTSIRRLTTQAGVSYAMLYDEVFYEGTPEEWCVIAQMDTPQVSAAFETVEFFLIDRGQETQMRTALEAFGTSLPDRVSLRTFDC